MRKLLTACRMVKAANIYALDFNLLPQLDSYRVFLSLGDEIKTALAKLPETLARANGACHHCHKVRSDGPIEAKESALRSALAELVSMEESLGRDLNNAGIGAAPVKITESQNPLLHIVRELRNLEIHLQTSRLKSVEKEVTYVGDNYQIDIWVAGDITESGFMKLRNAKRYKREDVVKMVDWFNWAQKEWGINQLIYRAVVEYCRMIIKTYSL